MIKKLRKYFKILLSILLIYSFIIPNYATLTSSDGSAFVTKAEFDSFTREINSRLTTFEAGINSKIDSQVTSYLDRNGIWSGLAIDLDSANTSVLYGVKEATTTISRKYLNVWQLNNQVTTRDILKKAVAAGAAGDFKLAENIGKSGLAFIVTKNGTAVHTDMRAVVGVVSSSGSINTANAKWIYTVTLTLYAGKWATKEGVARNRVTAQFVAGGSSLNIVCPEMVTGTVLFFTKKGEDLWYNLNETIDDNPTASAYGNDPCTLYLWGDNNCQSTRTYVFDSASVY